MKKTLKHKLYKYKTQRKRGRGITSSKPVVSPYPLLPETPTTRPEIRTNSESLLPPKPGSEEREKRFEQVLKRYKKIRPSLWNKKQAKLNKDGFPKSAFTINNAVGFKP
jgi:hypothetical protein